MKECQRIPFFFSGDGDYSKTRALARDVVKPCREYVAIATPDCSRTETNAIRLEDGVNKKLGFIADANGGDSPKIEDFVHEDVQKQVWCTFASFAC